MDELIQGVKDLFTGGHSNDSEQAESSDRDPYGDPGANVQSSDNDPYGDPGANVKSSDADPYGDPG